MSKDISSGGDELMQARRLIIENINEDGGFDMEGIAKDIVELVTFRRLQDRNALVELLKAEQVPNDGVLIAPVWNKAVEQAQQVIRDYYDKDFNNDKK